MLALSLFLSFWLLYFRNFVQVFFERSLFKYKGKLKHHNCFIQCKEKIGFFSKFMWTKAATKWCFSFHEIKSFREKYLSPPPPPPKIMTISTGLAISNSMSSFVPNIEQTGKLWWLSVSNVVDKYWTTEMYIPVHSWLFLSSVSVNTKRIHLYLKEIRIP